MFGHKPGLNEDYTRNKEFEDRVKRLVARIKEILKFSNRVEEDSKKLKKELSYENHHISILKEHLRELFAVLGYIYKNSHDNELPIHTVGRTPFNVIAVKRSYIVEKAVEKVRPLQEMLQKELNNKIRIDSLLHEDGLLIIADKKEVEKILAELSDIISEVRKNTALVSALNEEHKLDALQGYLVELRGINEDLTPIFDLLYKKDLDLKEKAKKVFPMIKEISSIDFKELKLSGVVTKGNKTYSNNEYIFLDSFVFKRMFSLTHNSLEIILSILKELASFLNDNKRIIKYSGKLERDINEIILLFNRFREFLNARGHSRRIA